MPIYQRQPCAPGWLGYPSQAYRQRLLRPQPAGDLPITGDGATM